MEIFEHQQPMTFMTGLASFGVDQGGTPQAGVPLPCCLSINASLRGQVKLKASPLQVLGSVVN